MLALLNDPTIRAALADAVRSVVVAGLCLALAYALASLIRRCVRP